MPFELMKDAVLGKKYNLSLVFIGNTLSRRLNRSYRNKDYPTNILSFPLEKDEGEIFINLAVAEKQAPLFGRNLKNFVAFLFIHGLVHLKGFEHGSKMESEEKRYRKKFEI